MQMIYNTVTRLTAGTEPRSEPLRRVLVGLREPGSTSLKRWDGLDLISQPDTTHPGSFTGDDAGVKEAKSLR